MKAVCDLDVVIGDQSAVDAGLAVLSAPPGSIASQVLPGHR